MDERELPAFSFIVRIWIEEPHEATHRFLWRGSITQVSSSRRRYIDHLDEIAAFILPCLLEMGVKPGVLWRFQRLLKQTMRVS